MGNARFEFGDDWEKKIVEAATPGIEQLWRDWCIRMRGKSHDEIRTAAEREWGSAFSDDLVGMLARGERVEPRVQH